MWRYYVNLKQRVECVSGERKNKYTTQHTKLNDNFRQLGRVEGYIFHSREFSSIEESIRKPCHVAFNLAWRCVFLVSTF